MLAGLRRHHRAVAALLVALNLTGARVVTVMQPSGGTSTRFSPSLATKALARAAIDRA